MKLRRLISAAILILVALTGCNNQANNGSDDGSPWVTFSKSGNPDILDDNIHAIYIAGSGQVWFGSDSGAFSYRSGVWSYPPRDSFSYYIEASGIKVKRQKVNAITGAYDGSLWFGLAEGGIQRLNEKTTTTPWQRYNLGITTDIASLKSDRVSVWVTTTLGAFEYIFPNPPLEPTQGFFKPAPSNSGITSADVRFVEISPVTFNVYFATGNMVAYYDVAALRWYNYTLPYDSPIRSLGIDYSNTVWCGRMTGVTSYNPEEDSTRHYTPGDGNLLPTSFVDALTTDFFGTTRWFGTELGLVQLNGQSWKLYTRSNTPALPSNKIQALAFDYVKKNLWIGTDKGVAVYNEEGFRP